MSQRSHHNWLRSLSRASAILAVLAFAAHTASAANLMFIGQYENLRPVPQLIDSIPASSPQTLVTTANGLTLPSKAFSQAFTFTAVFPGYPYFGGTALRYQRLGVFSVSYNPPNGTTTFNPTNATYPYVTFSPPNGFVRQKFGPNGLGGPMTLIKSTYYFGQAAATGGGYYNFAVPFTLTYGGCRFCVDIAGFSTATHTFLTTGAGAPVTNVKALKAWGAPPMTGTVTLSNPTPNAATYTVFTGMDNRVPTASGSSGTLQMIAPRIMNGYGLLGPPPAPMDGTATVTGIQTGLVGTNRTTLQVTPEPAQVALLACGILSLAGLRRMRRR